MTLTSDCEVIIAEMQREMDDRISEGPWRQEVACGVECDTVHMNHILDRHSRKLDVITGSQ